MPNQSARLFPGQPAAPGAHIYECTVSGKQRAAIGATGAMKRPYAATLLTALFVISASRLAFLHAEEAAKPMQVAICPRLVPELGGDEQAFIRRIDDLFVNNTEKWSYVSSNISHFKFYSTTVVWMSKQHPQDMETASVPTPAVFAPTP